MSEDNPDGVQFEIAVVAGPDHSQQLRLVLPLGEKITVGRDPSCELRVQRDQKVSRTHFTITAQPKSCLVEDLNSTGGTFVNGGRIQTSSIGIRDDIRAGDTRFTVMHIPVPGSQTAPPEEIEEASQHFAPAAVGQLAGFRDRTPIAIAASEQTDLSEEALAHIEDGVDNEAMLIKLGEQSLWLDAIRLAGHALPKRKAIWWGCACVREMSGGKLSPEDDEAITIAETWARSPGEESRRAAEQAATRLEHGTPAAWVAMGVFWAEGNIGPAHLEAPIPPAEDLTARAIRNAAVLAVVTNEPENADQHYEKLVSLAISLSKEEKPWE